MNKSVYIQRLSIMSVFSNAVWSIYWWTTTARFAVLHNTWKIKGAPVGHYVVCFGSVNCRPVNRHFPVNWLTGQIKSPADNNQQSESASSETASVSLKVVFSFICSRSALNSKLYEPHITTKIEKTFLFLVGGRGTIFWMGLMLQHQQHPP